MKIKKEFIEDISKLKEIGFDYEQITDDNGECYETKGKLTYNLGHSRRGQFYYLIIENDRSVSVLATEPDGSGTSINIDDVFMKLFKKDMLE